MKINTRSSAKTSPSVPIFCCISGHQHAQSLVLFLGILCIQILIFPANTIAADLPADNPVEALYPGQFPWVADSLKWDKVVNIEDYGGFGNDTKDDWKALDSINKTLYGGGVIYFPKGTYYFSDTISLLAGRILRGAAPDNKDALSKDFRPPTRFEFPKYNPTFPGDKGYVEGGTPNSTAFKWIATGRRNSGLVWLDINRARIAAGNFNVILGIRMNNAAKPSWGVPKDWQNPWQRFAGGTNIDAVKSSDVLIARCRLNDEVTDNFWFRRADGNPYLVQKEGGAIVEVDYQFRHSDVTGIATAGINNVIRDNYIYRTRGRGIDCFAYPYVSRTANSRIIGNVIRDDPNKRTDTMFVEKKGTGHGSNGCAPDWMNRGIEFTGYNVTIDSNDVQVFRHKLPQPCRHYSTNDGEGILIQWCSSAWRVPAPPKIALDKLYIRNNKVNSYIGLYKIGNIRDLEIKNNDIPMIWVAIDRSPEGGNSWLENADISGNICNTLRFWGNKGHKNNVKIYNNHVRNEFSIKCGPCDSLSNFKVYDNTYEDSLEITPKCESIKAYNNSKGTVAVNGTIRTSRKSGQYSVSYTVINDRIQISNTKPCTIEFFTLSGKLHTAFNLRASGSESAVLPSGMYLMRIRGTMGQAGSKIVLVP